MLRILLLTYYAKMRIYSPMLTSHEIIGYRFICSDFDSEPKIGEVLGNSFAWDGDQPTSDELGGTCCFESRKQVEEYAKYSKGCGWIIRVGGDLKSRGDDLVGEIIVRNAEVLEVEAW